MSELASQVPPDALICVMAINLKNGNAKSLEIRASDDPVELAKKFVVENGVPHDSLEGLALHIAENKKVAMIRYVDHLEAREARRKRRAQTNTTSSRCAPKNVDSSFTKVLDHPKVNHSDHCLDGNRGESIGIKNHEQHGNMSGLLHSPNVQGNNNLLGNLDSSSRQHHACESLNPLSSYIDESLASSGMPNPNESTHKPRVRNNEIHSVPPSSAELGTPLLPRSTDSSHSPSRRAYEEVYGAFFNSASTQGTALHAKIARDNDRSTVNRTTRKTVSDRQPSPKKNHTTLRKIAQKDHEGLMYSVETGNNPRKVVSPKCKAQGRTSNTLFPSPKDLNRQSPTQQSSGGNECQKSSEKVFSSNEIYNRLYEEAKERKQRLSNLRKQTQRPRQQANQQQYHVIRNGEESTAIPSADPVSLGEIIGKRLYEDGVRAREHKEAMLEMLRQEKEKLSDWSCPVCSSPNDPSSEYCMNALKHGKRTIVHEGSKIRICGTPHPVSHKPAISNLAKNLQGRKYTAEYIRFQHAAYEDALRSRQVAREEKEQQELAQQSFHPHINPSSNKLALAARARRLSNLKNRLRFSDLNGTDQMVMGSITDSSLDNFADIYGKDSIDETGSIDSIVSNSSIHDLLYLEGMLHKHDALNAEHGVSPLSKHRAVVNSLDNTANEEIVTLLPTQVEAEKNQEAKSSRMIPIFNSVQEREEYLRSLFDRLHRSKKTTGKVDQVKVDQEIGEMQLEQLLDRLYDNNEDNEQCERKKADDAPSSQVHVPSIYEKTKEHYKRKMEREAAYANELKKMANMRLTSNNSEHIIASVRKRCFAMIFKLLIHSMTMGESEKEMEHIISALVDAHITDSFDHSNEDLELFDTWDLDFVLLQESSSIPHLLRTLSPDHLSRILVSANMYCSLSLRVSDDPAMLSSIPEFKALDMMWINGYSFGLKELEPNSQSQENIAQHSSINSVLKHIQQNDANGSEHSHAAARSDPSRHSILQDAITQGVQDMYLDIGKAWLPSIKEPVLILALRFIFECLKEGKDPVRQWKKIIRISKAEQSHTLARNDENDMQNADGKQATYDDNASEGASNAGSITSSMLSQSFDSASFGQYVDTDLLEDSQSCILSFPQFCEYLGGVLEEIGGTHIYLLPRRTKQFQSVKSSVDKSRDPTIFPFAPQIDPKSYIIARLKGEQVAEGLEPLSAVPKSDGSNPASHIGHKLHEEKVHLDKRHRERLIEKLREEISHTSAPTAHRLEHPNSANATHLSGTTTQAGAINIVDLKKQLSTYRYDSERRREKGTSERSMGNLLTAYKMDPRTKKLLSVVRTRREFETVGENASEPQGHMLSAQDYTHSPSSATPTDWIPLSSKHSTNQLSGTDPDRANDGAQQVEGEFSNLVELGSSSPFTSGTGHSICRDDLPAEAENILSPRVRKTLQLRRKLQEGGNVVEPLSILRDYLAKYRSDHTHLDPNVDISQARQREYMKKRQDQATSRPLAVFPEYLPPPPSPAELRTYYATVNKTKAPRVSAVAALDARLAELGLLSEISVQKMKPLQTQVCSDTEVTPSMIYLHNDGADEPFVTPKRGLSQLLDSVAAANKSISNIGYYGYSPLSPSPIKPPIVHPSTKRAPFAIASPAEDSEFHY